MIWWKREKTDNIHNPDAFLPCIYIISCSGMCEGQLRGDGEQSSLLLLWQPNSWLWPAVWEHMEHEQQGKNKSVCSYKDQLTALWCFCALIIQTETSEPKEHTDR